MADITDAGPRLRQMNDALTGYDQMRAEIERLRAEVAMLKDAAEKLYDIAASGAEPPQRRRMLDQMAMESFAENG